MKIYLTTQLETFIQNQVASGMYESDDEVVCEGLRLLREQYQLPQFKIAKLSAAIQQGLDSGEATPLDIEKIISKCHTDYSMLPAM